MKQLGKKATVSAIAENNNMSRKQIYRYIRLNELIAEFQEWVDKGIITIEAAVELSFISEEKQHIIFEHINGMNIAYNVITRHFKVATTKRIHTVADNLSDDEFSANIEKILFSAYEGKPTAPTAQVGLEVPHSAVAEKKAIVVTEQPDPTAPEAQNELKNILSASKNGQPIKFRNEEHERNYNFILDMMPYSDIERKALAYLFALDTVCFEHIRDLYDFSDNRILLSGIDKGWHTGTSKRTTRLAFNLFNSFCSDSIENDLPSVSFTPVELFCSEYAKFYVEALRIRFPEFFEGGF